MKGKLTDQEILAKIAVQDEHDDVRRAAVDKLTDQALLGKIDEKRFVIIYRSVLTVLALRLIWDALT